MMKGVKMSDRMGGVIKRGWWGWGGWGGVG